MILLWVHRDLYSSLLCFTPAVPFSPGFGPTLSSSEGVPGLLLRIVAYSKGRSLSGDGSHIGDVVLCWGFVEQARHEHMSDEYENQDIIDVPL